MMPDAFLITAFTLAGAACIIARDARTLWQAEAAAVVIMGLIAMTFAAAVVFGAFR
jgi:hypothetical protein